MKVRVLGGVGNRVVFKYQPAVNGYDTTTRRDNYVTTFATCTVQSPHMVTIRGQRPDSGLVQDHFPSFMDAHRRTR